jgi:hypothetical protein
MITPSLLLLSLAVQAEQVRTPVVVNGIPTTTPLAVAALVVELDGALYGPFCSATLVDSKWALTAAHCIEAIDRDYGGADIYLLTGGDLLTTGYEDAVLVSRTIGHPDYDDTWYTDDIGLLELAGMGLLGVPAIPLNSDPVNSTWIDRELRFMGYGITSDNASDMGIKRYADMPVVTYDTGIIYAFDPDDGQNVCQGDSGGAALEEQSDGSWELAGVNAFVGLWKHQESGSPCQDGFVGSTRVDVHIDWIIEQTGGDVLPDTGAPDGGTSAFPGRDSGGWCAAAPVGARGLGLLLLSLGLVGWRRR